MIIVEDLQLAIIKYIYIYILIWQQQQKLILWAQHVSIIHKFSKYSKCIIIKYMNKQL